MLNCNLLRQQANDLMKYHIDSQPRLCKIIFQDQKMVVLFQSYKALMLILLRMTILKYDQLHIESYLEVQNIHTN